MINIEGGKEGQLEFCIKEGSDEVYSDYQTKERLLSPFLLIALQGSKKGAVPINVSTLEKNLIIDNLLPSKSESYLGMVCKGEKFYTVLAANADYNPTLPNLVDYFFEILDIKGYFHEDVIRRELPEIYKYFNLDVLNKEEQTSEAEDNIPF